MSRPFEVHLPTEQAYLRQVLFAVEILDAVTLSRVAARDVGRRDSRPRRSQELKVVAEGLQGTPIVNARGLFVWLTEDIEPLQRITIDPGLLPYETFELPAAQLQRPLHRIELPPRGDYPFPAGITGLRGTLIEERSVPPQRPVPIPNAEVHLRWLDDDGITWRDARTASHTSTRGDFVTVLRFARSDVPRLDANGALTVRLRVRRDTLTERGSPELKLPQGSVADPSAFAQDPGALTFAWDELQP